MTAREIQKALICSRIRTSKVWPNYKPRGWWECDLMEVTTAGYWVEYEIKVSLSDFRADFQKERSEWQAKRDGNLPQKKHDRLRQCQTENTPRRFYFVCPAGLIPRSELPSYAGLIEMSDVRFRLTETEVVRAPDRHREKMPQVILEHAHGVCYWRWHNLLASQK